MFRKISVVCFGEVLWDIFPEGAEIGGAPLNVAYHLNNLGMESHILSRVGQDEWGKQLIRQIKDWGISTQNCQVDHQWETGKVRARVGANGDTDYDILKPAAWDFIAQKDYFRPLMLESEALVFGTLGMRHPVSRKTLFSLMNLSGYKVFDVNFRPPHYNKDMVLKALEKTDFLKLNHEELEIISRWIQNEEEQEKVQVEKLRSLYKINEVLVTKGRIGATYYADQQSLDVEAFPVKVKNTVGSGDAFLAAFLNEKFNYPSKPKIDQLKRAALLGSFVAGKEGACPGYNSRDLEQFKETISQ